MNIRNRKKLLKEIQERNRRKNNRSWPRAVFFMDALVTAGDRTFAAHMRNISPEGAFVRTTESVPLEETVILDFGLPITEEKVQLEGKVVRKTEEGFAVRFETTIEELLYES